MRVVEEVARVRGFRVQVCIITDKLTKLFHNIAFTYCAWIGVI